MRAAAFFSTSIIAVGVYLTFAAALALSTAWIAVGVLTIGTVAALALMAGDRRSARPPTRAA